MKRSMLFVVILIQLSSFVFAKTYTKTATLKKLLINRIDAVIRKDTAALNQICSKDYKLISINGERVTLEQYKKQTLSRFSPIRSYTVLSFQPFVADDESMAFAISEVEEEMVHNNGIIKNNLIITEVYIKERYFWRTQMTHITRKVYGYSD